MSDDQNKEELQALCMKCRQRGKEHQMQVMENVEINEKNNRYSAKGTCKTCGTNMFKFLSKENAEAMQK